MSDVAGSIGPGWAADGGGAGGIMLSMLRLIAMQFAWLLLPVDGKPGRQGQVRQSNSTCNMSIMVTITDAHPSFASDQTRHSEARGAGGGG